MIFYQPKWNFIFVKMTAMNSEFRRQIIIKWQLQKFRISLVNIISCYVFTTNPYFTCILLLFNIPFTIDTVKGSISEKHLSKNFIDICFKFFLNRIYILKEKVPTFEKKPPWPVPPYSRAMSFQVQYVTFVNCRLFLTLNKISNTFLFKDPIPQILTSVIAYKFQCRLSN